MNIMSSMCVVRAGLLVAQDTISEVSATMMIFFHPSEVQQVRCDRFELQDMVRFS